MHNGSTTTQEHKDLCGNPFSLNGKITGQTPNNFTILNRDYNTQRYNLSKEKTSLFLFTHYSLSHCVSLTIFSCSLYFSLLFCLLSLTQFSKTTLSSISLTGTSLHSSASRICLGSAYFTVTKNSLLKVLQINVKVSCNSIVGPINSTKKCNRTYKQQQK